VIYPPSRREECRAPRLDLPLTTRQLRTSASCQPAGLAFRFPAKEFDAGTEFVGRERLCCQFLIFTMNYGPSAVGT
jgi:hypothetical protein